jgi:pimeloyl-ACP methyl ester carboxylesterase
VNHSDRPSPFVIPMGFTTPAAAKLVILPLVVIRPMESPALSVNHRAGFVAQLDAVVAHDASQALAEIRAPTLITFGARDLVCSTRFAARLHDGIADSELVVFEQLSHAGLHEDPEAFNRATLDFLLRQRS